MANCYVCGRALDHENQTEKHIFLNAIGGHLMSKELICQKCNSDFGDNIDTSLAEQFNMISALLNIKRDRGTPQPFKAIDSQNDIGYIVKPGGKILLQKPDIKQDGNHYRGDSVEKMLIAYIELFDFYKVIILLNGRYEDENIEYSYFYDVLSRKVVHREYELNILKYDVQSSLAHNTPYAEIYKRVQPYLNTVIGKALNLQTKEHIRDLLDKARENFCRKTEGTNLTESDKRKLLVDETMNQLTPWIPHTFGEHNGNHFDH